MPRPPDFFSKMTRSDLEALEAFAREPKNGLAQVHEWLLVHGFTASRSAAHRWFKRFKETDNMSIAAEFVDAVETAHDESGAIDLGKGARLMLSQRLVNRLAKDSKSADIEYLEKAAATLERLTRTGRHSVKLEGELMDFKKRQTDAIKAAEAAVTKGASAGDVVATIKKALGIAA